MSKIYILTGTTSGLGLSTIQHLSQLDSGAILIAGVRHPDNVKQLRDSLPGNQLRVSKLDTSSIESVTKFAENVQKLIGSQKISGLLLNAGVQIISEKKHSSDGYELTFATNVIGHIMLYFLLQEQTSSDAIIVSTASGTHDPESPLSKKYGFKGGCFPSANAVAYGNYGRDNLPDAGLDRYATSKLCNIMFTYAMANQLGEKGPRFIAFDPGMMPGTKLARDRSKIIQFAWNNLLPVLMKFSKGVSSPQKSGKILAELLLGLKSTDGSGLHIEFTNRPTKTSKLSYDKAKQKELIDFARNQLALRN